MQKIAHDIWFNRRFLFYPLLPLSLCYGVIVFLRRLLYQIGWLKSYHSPIPVLVIGNLTVGGNGKTPLVVWAVELLKKQDIKVAVISRGYGAKPPHFPFLVNSNQNPLHTGDEPLLIAERTRVPVVISPDRKAAIELILKTAPETQIIISDDGLQHYALARDLEWVVVDAKKGFGNGHYLPAGPMRERADRLKNVNAVIINYGSSQPGELATLDLYTSPPDVVAKLYLKPIAAIHLKTGKALPLSEFNTVNAIAGIGFPERFYQLLTVHNITISQRIDFNDHHNFQCSDFITLDDDLPLFMTEKDAMKCRKFAQNNWWYVPIASDMSCEDTNELSSQLFQIITR